MKRAEKARRIGAILDRLYPDPGIPLEHADPFTLLVAVLLSAQTTDARVNLVTPGLFRRAPTPAAMARLPLDEIHALIRTCGLAPQKSKALKALSQLIVERHAGRVPDTFEELEALPGVGHKTASVVMAQAFAYLARRMHFESPEALSRAIEAHMTFARTLWDGTEEQPS